MLCRQTHQPRRGAAAAEFAVLLPLIVFCFVVGIDFARVYYYSIIVTYCARDGATYACWSKTNALDTAGIQSAVTNDESGVSGITVNAPTYNDNTNPTVVTVSVTYTFKTLAHYVIPNQFNVPQTWVITRSCTTYIAPDTPS